MKRDILKIMTKYQIHMKLKKIFLAALLLPVTLLAADAPQTIPLWPNGAPGFEARKDIPEQAAS